MEGMNDPAMMQAFFRSLITFLIIPGLAIIGWFVRGIIKDVYMLKEAQNESSKNHAVATVQLHNIQDDIREIKTSLDKLLDRRQYNRNEKPPRS